MGRHGLWLLFTLGALALATACTRKTEGYCCTSADLCADVGGVLQQCPSGQICDDLGAEGPRHSCVSDPTAIPCDQDPSVCVAPTPACVGGICVECADDAHCTSAAAPVCDLSLNRCGDCGSNADCERFGGVCGGSGMCVQCDAGATPVESDACADDMPICDTNGTCRACTDHRECGSGACELGAGVCVDAAEIAYVDASAPAGNTACTQGAPCPTIALGLMADSGARRYVVIAPGTYLENVVLADRDVALIGYGATLRPSAPAPIVSVTGTTAQVEIWGALITSADFGVDCNGGVASSAARVSLFDVHVDDLDDIGVNIYRCDLVMRRTRVTRADFGGVSLNSAGFDIANSVITGNGVQGAFGGIQIQMPRPAPSRIVYTTVADNQIGTGTAAGGIACASGTGLPPFQNNIITGNEGDQVSGFPNCDHAYSLINPPITGTAIVQGDPLFTADYHIGAGSAAIGAATPIADVTDDIDGEPRSGVAPDVGADELTR